MKNLFTYKNNIASGLKRYGKFLLLAISLLFLSNTAWAAPTDMWLWYCGHASNQWNEENLQPVQMKPLGNNRWSYDIDLTINDYQFFFATSNSKSSILEEDKLDLKDFSPSCATSSTQIEGYNLQGKNNAGRLHVGHSNGDCQITLVVTYISNSEYIIQVDSPCIEADPIVTTGTGTRNGSNQLVISGNVLDELYKDNNCNRNLDRLGVQILGTDKTSDKGYYEFSKGNDKLWTDYRGKEYTITYPGTEQVCYRAFANYGGHYGYGDIKCTQPDPSGTKPSIRIGKQPVVIDNKDVDLNFQLADWGCTEVTKVKVYYTTDGSEPTESSQVVELTTSQNGNKNFTLTWKNVPSGNYNIKAVACNASGCGEVLSDMASFVTQCDNPAAPIVDKTEATLCQGAEEQFTITNYTSELTYKVFKNGIETDIVITDGEFTLLESGEYVVKVKNNCSNYIPSETINVVVNSKPAAPTINNSNRESCTLQNVSFIIAMGNNVIITMNEGTSTTAPAPVDGNEYEGETVPATIANDLAKVIGLAVDPTKDYTLTCYQYNAASLCYSEPVTFYIPKNLAIITEVEVTNVERITADVTVTANAGPVPGTAVAELYLEWRVKGSGDAWTGGSPNIVANPVYQITMLTEGTTYEVRAKAKNNSGCDGNGFGYSEIVEFTTKTCPVLTPQTVTGDNTTGKVQATITMASSQTDAIYQLFIGDTPIDGSVQEGTGEALTWQVNQTGLYYVKGWFKEVPDGCANGATIMGRYDLDCVQAPTPVISIDKNTICSNDNATISVTAVEGVTYQLYKDGDLVSDKNITNDGEFTGITEAGSYTVVATTKDKCQATATSQIVTLTVIDASASVTINPTTDTTTPWVPVNFTVTSTAGAPYTLVYKDAAGNDVTDQMVVVKKGNSYSLKIPRPATTGWEKGNSTDPVATTTYTVEASLEGQASCGSTSTLTITLNDTFEICE